MKRPVYLFNMMTDTQQATEVSCVYFRIKEIAKNKNKVIAVSGFRRDLNDIRPSGMHTVSVRHSWIFYLSHLPGSSRRRGKKLTIYTV